MPFDFGIGGFFEVDLFHKRQLDRKKSVKIFKNLCGAIIVVLSFISFEHVDRDGRSGNALFASWFVFVAYFGLFPERFIGRLLMIGSADYELSKQIERYEAEKADFDRFVLTTELGFWCELRGITLENEVAALFREAGWQVDTTPTVGDGGIDLKVTRGAQTFWCQCKGHGKPVTVKAVREIAGVCVGSDAKPVLIVVNGLTKPAADEAAKLGVRVFDSPDLAAMARGVKIFTPNVGV